MGRVVLLAAGAAGAAALLLAYQRLKRRAAAETPCCRTVSAVGVVGLGVMGSQLVLNFAEKLRRPVSGFDLDAQKASATITLAAVRRFIRSWRPPALTHPD